MSIPQTFVSIDELHLPEPPKRILLQTVGTGGGPQNPVWEALAFAVHELQPDLLVHLCSKETAEKTVPKFLDALMSPVKVRLERICLDPDKVERLVLEYGELLDELIKRYPVAEFHVDFTSGTKPMSAAVVAVGISRRASFLHYATGKRDETGRVTKTDQIEKVDTSHLVAERQLEELGRLFNRGEFTAVHKQVSQLKNLLTEPKLKARAESLYHLSAVCKCWDQFKWNAARLELRAIQKAEKDREVFSLAGWNTDLFDQHKDFLLLCEAQKPSPERQADLLANVDRRLENGQFDDAVSRLYRLTELLLQERFSWRNLKDSKDLQNPTANVPLDQLQKTAPLASDRLKNKVDHKNRVSIGLTDTMRILAEAKDTVAAEMWDDYTGGTGEYNLKKMGKLHRLLEARNNSWLAHGTKSADESVARELRESVLKYLRAHLKAYEKERSTLGDFDDLLTHARFQTCPWG